MAEDIVWQAGVLILWVKCLDQINGTLFCGSRRLSICICCGKVLNQDDSWKERIGFDGEILQIKVGTCQIIANMYIGQL